MNHNNRTEKISIRVRPDILEACDNICDINKYSRADVFEMGVLLLETNNENDKVIQNKIYTEMISRFEKLNEKIHEEFSTIQNNICSEIDTLKEKNNSIEINQTDEYRKDELDMAVNEIIKTISLRENELKYPKHTRTIFEPLGKEYYELIASRHTIPYKIILEELHKRGYSDDYLLELGMNPLKKYCGEKECGKSTIMQDIVLHFVGHDK